jgi:ABC-2 type transport system permease protein
VTALVRSELRKLLTTQVWFWMLLIALALTALFVVGTILSDGVEGNTSPPLATPEGQRNLFAITASGAAFLSAVLGIIGITGEYRHFTVTPTFLATPRRGRVVAAKLVVYAGVGLLFGVLSAVLVTAMAVPWLSARGVDVSLTANRIPLVILAAVIVVGIYGILGVGVGSLVRNQVAAVVITLAYLFVVENILAALPWVRDHLSKWLPGQAAQAVTQVQAGGSATLLDPWQGGLVLAAYGLVFAILGSLLTVRRDVT